MHIYRAGVVGAGTMGAAIAQVISESGVPVALKDVDQAVLDKGMAAIGRSFQRRVDRGQMRAHDVARKLDLIKPTLSYEPFANVDIVIEAVPEKMALKKAVLQELQAIVPETTIFASNASALSISEMAASTDRPHKVIGMHFFNPAHVMKLVEVIPGLDTSSQTVDDVLAFAESLGKTAVVVQECPGFLVNRLLMPYLNEATYCLQEGVATAIEIDAAVVAFGMPMGPFALMDMLGIDVCQHIAEYLFAEYGPRMTPAPLLGKLAASGRLGAKSGGGFYDPDGAMPASVLDMIAGPDRQEQPGEEGRGHTFDVTRVMYPLINEAAIALQEHIAARHDIDLAMVIGTGMTYKGTRRGPLAIADEIGLDVVLDGLNALFAQHGERFRPARLLRTKVRAGHLGVKTRRGFFEYA